jgi:uncharacterized protein YecT (DUF1311 family)
MAERREPKPSTIKALFAKSGNQCAYPGCSLPLVDDQNILVAEVCHINAVKKQDARWDGAVDADFLRSYENLILLCHGHHKRIDSLAGKYPVERLQEMRRNHEDTVLTSAFQVEDSIIAESIFELTAEDFSWDLERVADDVEALISDGTVWAQQHMNRMEANVCSVLDAQMHFLYLKALRQLPPQQKLTFIVRHEAWKSERCAHSEASVESHGGSLAPLEYAMAYAEATRRRIAHLRAITTNDANNRSIQPPDPLRV